MRRLRAETSAFSWKVLPLSKNVALLLSLDELDQNNVTVSNRQSNFYNM